MGTLIHKAIELDFFGVAAPISLVSIPIVLILVHSVHTWLTNKKVDKMTDKNVKIPSELLVETILIIIGVGGFTLIYTQHITSRLNLLKLKTI